ncbi:MAG: DNA methylase [Gammaproteobacteria bacterium]|nr:DNA methylase [Gammaproteobacteria bacterium]
MATELNQLKRSLLYSEELGIALNQRREQEYFKWFVASLLFGGRISETIAKNTYRTFARYHLLTPRRIVNAGWEFLVDPIMREGGYVRYDGRKSEQILRDCQVLLDRYRGKLTELHDRSNNSRDLEDKLLEFYGVGPITVNIFLRELRPYWKHADPSPLPRVTEVAARLALDLDTVRRKTVSFTRIEAGIIRLRKRRNLSV